MSIRLNRIQNFFVGRELSGLVLAVNAVSVDDHVEDAAATRYQFALDVGGTLDRRRQTDGSRRVVSLVAVGDANLHGFHPSVLSSL